MISHSSLLIAFRLIIQDHRSSLWMFVAVPEQEPDRFWNFRPGSHGHLQQARLGWADKSVTLRIPCCQLWYLVVVDGFISNEVNLMKSIYRSNVEWYTVTFKLEIPAAGPTFCWDVELVHGVFLVAHHWIRAHGSNGGYRGQNLAPDVSERRWDGAGWMVFLQSPKKDKRCHGLEPSAIKL